MADSGAPGTWRGCETHCTTSGSSASDTATSWLGYSGADGPGTVSVGTLIEQAGERERRVFLKMDIEGGEYDVVDDLVAHADRINCIVGEFHRIGKKAASFNAALGAFNGPFRWSTSTATTTGRSTRRARCRTPWRSRS